MAQDFYKKDGSYFLTSGQKIANPQELSTFAKAGGKEVSAPSIPTGMVAIPGAQYNTAEKQKSAFSNIQPIGGTLYGVPIQTTLTTDQMGAGSNIPPATPTTFGDVDAIMAGAKPTQEALRSTVEQYMTNLKSQEKKDAVDARIETEQESMYKDRTASVLKAQKDYDMAGNIKNLQNLNVAMAQKEAAFNNYEAGLEGKVASASSIYGRQALVRRQSAVELAGLSAVAQAYQGNIDLANDTAQNGIDALYKPQEDYINNLQEQLDSIEEDLTREDKVRADALKAVLDERTRLLTEEKENKQSISEIMLLAAQGGADVATINKIIKSKNPREAIVNAGEYLSTVDPKDDMPVSIGDDLYWDPTQNKVVSGSDLTAPTDPITGAPTDPSKVFNGYNFTSYATDIDWGNKIKGIMESLPALNNVSSLDAYIKSKNSSIANNNKNNTSENAIAIWQSAQESGVPVELLTAISQLESGFGTSNVAKSNNNPGGVTWNKNFPVNMKGTARPSAEGGNYVKFQTLKDGFNSVASNIAKRYQGVSANTTTSKTDQMAIDIFNGTGSLTKVSTKDYPKVQAKLSELKEEAKASGDLEGIMRASAGGKDVDATTATSFEKAFNVIGQLGELQSSITDEQTGPIIGIIKSKNPYDEKAKLIQAQLIAIIPNLARGIYGEVGVLTDNDVKLYAQTLPNLKSTEEVRKLILASTVRSVQRSIENKIKVQSGLGRDLSGLADTYTEIKALADSLEGDTVNKDANDEYVDSQLGEITSEKTTEFENNKSTTFIGWLKNIGKAIINK